MKHVFEFYIDIKGDEQPLHSTFVTDSSRYSKAGKQLIKELNRQRMEYGLSIIDGNEDLKEFRMKQLR